MTVEKSGARSQSGLSVRVKRSDGAAILECRGRLQFRGEAELFTATASKMINEGLHVILDFGELEVIDSAGIGKLVLVHMEARAKECDVCIARPNRFVQKLLRLTNVASLFEIHATVEQALESMHESVSG